MILYGVIIVLIIIALFYLRSVENALMKGFWKADIDFCENADLDMFILYIGESDYYNTNGYFLAKNKLGIILNNPVKLYFDGFNMPFISNKDYEISIDWLGFEHNSEALPSIINMCYYPYHNKIILYKDDTTYAILYKDSSMSCSVDQPKMPLSLLESDTSSR